MFRPGRLTFCPLQLPDVLGVLADGAVGGEDAALGDVHEAHAGEAAAVAHGLIEPVVAGDVGGEVASSMYWSPP